MSDPLEQQLKPRCAHCEHPDSHCRHAGERERISAYLSLLDDCTPREDQILSYGELSARIHRGAHMHTVACIMGFDPDCDVCTGCKPGCECAGCHLVETAGMEPVADAMERAGLLGDPEHGFKRACECGRATDDRCDYCAAYIPREGTFHVCAPNVDRDGYEGCAFSCCAEGPCKCPPETPADERCPGRLKPHAFVHGTSHDAGDCAACGNVQQAAIHKPRLRSHEDGLAATPG